MCIIVVKLCAVWTNYLKMQPLTCRFSWKFSLKADSVTSDRAGCPYLQQVSFQNVFPLRDLGKNGTLGSKFCHPRRDLSNLFQMHLNVTLYLILLLRKDRILIHKRRHLKSLLRNCIYLVSVRLVVLDDSESFLLIRSFLHTVRTSDVYRVRSALLPQRE